MEQLLVPPATCSYFLKVPVVALHSEDAWEMVEGTKLPPRVQAPG